MPVALACLAVTTTVCVQKVGRLRQDGKEFFVSLGYVTSLDTWDSLSQVNKLSRSCRTSLGLRWGGEQEVLCRIIPSWKLLAQGVQKPNSETRLKFKLSVFFAIRLQIAANPKSSGKLLQNLVSMKKKTKTVLLCIIWNTVKFQAWLQQFNKFSLTFETFKIF